MLRGLVRDRTHSDESYSKQEPRLKGPAATEPIAILSLSRAGPNFIYSIWVWQSSKTKSQYILKKIQKHQKY